GPFVHDYETERYLVVAGLAVCLACNGVVADLYHQQMSCSHVQCELCSLKVCPR
ncbi:hypothetical protein Taro_050435, partial [Colocasia esculenta]|nr:hypothetical protein [Colocasia esculenta]